MTAGLSYRIGAVIPLAAMIWLPRGEQLALTFVAILFALRLTGWFAAWLTGLPVTRLGRRNIVLGSAVMAAGILAGLARHRELHIADVIPARGEIRKSNWISDGTVEGPGRFDCAECTGARIPLKGRPRSRMPGESAGY